MQVHESTQVGVEHLLYQGCFWHPAPTTLHGVEEVSLWRESIDEGKGKHAAGTTFCCGWTGMQSCAMCCTHPLGKFQNQVNALLVLECSILQAGKQGWDASGLKVWQGSQQCARLPPVPDTYKVYYVGVAQRGVNRNLSFNLQHAAHIRAVTGLYITSG